MSLMHSFIESFVRHDHHPYVQGVIPNYKQRRIQEEKRFKHLPKDLKVTLIDQDEIKGEFISKDGNSSTDIIFYIHGGGFVTGSAKSRRDLTFYLARHSGYNVMAINYSLAPEYKFPKPVEECFKAYKSLITKYGSNHISIMGESAGGNLVLATLQMAIDNKIALPKSVVLFSPATVLGKQLPSYIKNGNKDAMLDSNSHLEIIDTYFNSLKDNDNKYASPLYGSYLHFPPTLLFASDSEVLLDDSLLLKEKMQDQEVDITFDLAHNLMHAYVTMPYFKEAKASLRKTIKFINDNFNK